jgi:c-di-GMP-binding flagellar brake protein YcgR
MAEKGLFGRITGWLAPVDETEARRRHEKRKALERARLARRANRRLIRRVSAGFEVRCLVDGNEHRGRALDISPNGMQLNVSRIERAAGEVYLIFKIPGALDQRPAKAIGKVVRAESVEGKKRLGILFEAMHREVKTAICEYVAKMTFMCSDLQPADMFRT